MRRSSILLAFAALSAATPVVAASSLTAPLGQTVRIPIRGSATDVIVGDTKIADVTVVGPDTLFVSGRGYGSTNVVVVGSGGRTLFDGRVLVPMPNAGQVTVYRGSAQSSVLCAPLCSPPIENGGGDKPTFSDLMAKLISNAGASAGPAPAPPAS